MPATLPGRAHSCGTAALVYPVSFGGRSQVDTIQVKILPGGGVEQAWSNRVAEIRSRDSSQRGADGMEVEKITDNDLGTGRGQALGTRVAAVDKGSDTVSTLKQQAHRGI